MAESAQQVANQAQEQAQQVASKASDQIRSQVDQRSTQAGEKVSSTASDIRSISEELRNKGQDGPARLAEQAAQRAERVGSWLKESDADRILGDVEDFGRRKPWALALGGLVLGAAASRFLKASSAQRYQSRQQFQTTGTVPFHPGNGAPAASPVPPTPSGESRGFPEPAGVANGGER
jgi:hypothetical protein